MHRKEGGTQLIYWILYYQSCVGMAQTPYVELVVSCFWHLRYACYNKISSNLIFYWLNTNSHLLFPFLSWYSPKALHHYIVCFSNFQTWKQIEMGFFCCVKGPMVVWAVFCFMMKFLSLWHFTVSILNFRYKLWIDDI